MEGRTRDSTGVSDVRNGRAVSVRHEERREAYGTWKHREEQAVRPDMNETEVRQDVRHRQVPSFSGVFATFRILVSLSTSCH